jgi:acetyl-CoA carboxylase carboxyl transferase subunit alpha
VISPEGCAAILWGDRSKAPQAAEALKLTAADLSELKVIDQIVPEPMGGAHRDPESAAATLKEAVAAAFLGIEAGEPERLLKSRVQKYERLGAYQDSI